MRRFKTSICHSVKRYYKCEECDYKVYSETGLKLHTKKVHSLDISSIKNVDHKTCGSCRKPMALHSRKRGNCP